MAEEKSEKIHKSDAEWQALLSPEEFHICRLKGTERAFTGALYKEKREGTYLCKCCGEPLFVADAKYDSGCGWPSFFQPADEAKIDEYRDTSHGMIRTEVCCSRCDAHLGHLFPDGPAPTGIRYCINSASLSFVPEDK